MRRSVLLQSVFVPAIVALVVTLLILALMDASPGEGDTGNESIAPITSGQRETVQLQVVTLQETVTGQGKVVEDGDRFYLESAVAQSDLAYRLLDSPVAIRARIDGGPAGFDCAWQGLRETPEGMRMRCEIPATVRVISGLTGTMVLQMSEPITVQGVPSSAVIGRSQAGQVVVVDQEGNTSVRSVILGKSDATYTEILDGLNADESIYLFPIEADLVRDSGE
ncbi:MAG: hypothetical protein M9953_02150 [Thermomicrobiales bacterium]|nr:hypothetical protein [Thermomicrobiales bacterium]MCO5217580.1 hypothetical protein [Thermomicrobiales bacterium]MCO5224114.1 hypothetical protein [Thermomicrobiales bacterium]MCO5226949.1 hypothetical protein [Thermomicrobiales bacterium]